MSTFRHAGVDAEELARWMAAREVDHQHLLSRGRQAAIYLYSRGDIRLAIKTAYGRGFAAWLRRYMLRNEAKIYEQLSGIDGVAYSHGLLEGKYLVLEYFEPLSSRINELEDREQAFIRLRNLIDAIHAAGVAHGDLKTRANILLTTDHQPHIVDFGIAVLRKPGFAPLNHWLFGLFRQFDRNAWIKLKYRKRMEDISAEDRAWYRFTAIERLARKVRRMIRRFRR